MNTAIHPKMRANTMISKAVREKYCTTNRTSETTSAARNAHDDRN
ncbi:hypothetical protein Q9S36_23030 [Microbacterium sp. ARD31]|nr:hypothetical protein [Microbacterium sp. ARD31]MDT0183059.1 hypothetical protein [Microbacterium sp. ARD31]